MGTIKEKDVERRKRESKRKEKERGGGRKNGYRRGVSEKKRQK